MQRDRASYSCEVNSKTSTMLVAAILAFALAALTPASCYTDPDQSKQQMYRSSVTAISACSACKTFVTELKQQRYLITGMPPACRSRLLVSTQLALRAPSSLSYDPCLCAVAKLQVLKGQLAARGPVWTANVANWTCPTPPATTTSNETCDPCGKAQWWGNWEYF